jgi:hypothetical protein
LALLPKNAVELDSFTVVVELAVDQHVHLGLAGTPFHLYLLVGECLVLEVGSNSSAHGRVTLLARAATGLGARASSLVVIAEP